MKKEIQEIIEKLYQDEIVGNDGDIKKIEDYIKSSECCGNCKHYEESQCQLDDEPESYIGSFVCDDWESNFENN